MKPDLFDRIMAWRLLRPLEPFYKKHKEVLLYLFFGGLTFFLSLGCYAFFTRICGLTPLVSNGISWVICVLFAYVTNHIWVFESAARGTAGIMKELLSFCAGRLATLVMEEAMLWVGIDLLGINDMLVKLVAQIAVIIGNYVISKLFVFRKK